MYNHGLYVYEVEVENITLFRILIYKWFITGKIQEIHVCIRNVLVEHKSDLLSPFNKFFVMARLGVRTWHCESEDDSCVRSIHPQCSRLPCH